ncbi:MAG: FAD-dependent oxidoreductase [Deltaproteobacteria bacterium]|nr:FAD-dependent oxidoreductase [Deltaproteobacteria bacterium]
MKRFLSRNYKSFRIAVLLLGALFIFAAFNRPAGDVKVPEKSDVVIIGAGLSGLATAYNLKKAGISYHILELTPRIGGRVRTVYYQRADGPELYADSGMEEYWESNPAINFLWDLRLPIRHDFAASSIVLHGKLTTLDAGEDSVAFQKKIFSAAELKAFEAFRKTVEPILKTLKSVKPVPRELLKLKDLSFARWVRGRKLPGKVAEWIRISIECEIGTSWEQIAALDGIAEFHIFMGKGEESYRVVGGNELLTGALAKTIGVERISVNKRVSRVVSASGNQVDVYYADTATNTSGVIRAHHVVSTIPIYRLSEVQFEPALSRKKLQAIESQGYGAYFKAHVFVPAEASRFWTKNGVSFLPILSDSALGVIYDGNPDQQTKTKIVSLLATGDQAEAFNMMPLDQVRAIIHTAFDKLWPGFSKEIQTIEFYRYHPRAIAAWPVGRSRFDELSEEIRRPENRVYLAGDFTEDSHSSGAFVSASRVAGQILAAEHKPAAKGN